MAASPPIRIGLLGFGTVGSAEKAALVRRHGCDHAILYRETDFVPAVKALVPKGVDAVFDGVGKDTFAKSFECTRRFGMIVNYGNASGQATFTTSALLVRPRRQPSPGGPIGSRCRTASRRPRPTRFRASSP